MLSKVSLPLWECGLKYYFTLNKVRDYKSLPLWECGLKWLMLYRKDLWIYVTPLVGVWIEILHNRW